MVTLKAFSSNPAAVSRRLYVPAVPDTRHWVSASPALHGPKPVEAPDTVAIDSLPGHPPLMWS